MNRAGDLKTLQEARPYIRSALAFLVFMRLGICENDAQYYETADVFLNQLERDLRGEEKS